MKTRNYLISTVLIVSLLINADAQAKTGHSSARIGNPGLHRGRGQVITHQTSRSSHTRPGLVITGGSHRRSAGISISTSGFHFSTSLIPSLRSRYSNLHRRSTVISHRRPLIIQRPAPVRIHQSTVTVWITNPNGSSTPVVLIREGPWYIGPRGERYYSLPTQHKLRPLYGLHCDSRTANKITIYIPTWTGGKIPVTLIATAEGYIGPKGELYTKMPTENQLAMIYGR